MRISFVEKETTMTTDKNNSCHPGATAPGFKIAARFRGEKEDVVFTSCSGCFQKNLQASDNAELYLGKPPCGGRGATALPGGSAGRLAPPEMAVTRDA